MLFSSVIFLFAFLPLFLLAYLLVPAARKGVLLAGSLIFYAWGEPIYVFLMLISILANYGLALWVSGSERGVRTFRVACGIAFNVGVLSFFKYGDFVLGLVGIGADTPLRQLFSHLPLPLGISFFTFQGIAYLLDVYSFRTPVEVKLANIAVYKALFPQLIAGPIVRYDEIREALGELKVRPDQFARGIVIFVQGLAAKVLIANPLATPADDIFGIPAADLTTPLAWLGAICYSLQIYFDFWGYSLMAIGLGKMLGFEFPANFNHPYTARSITDFWRRWHITLSTWFRDYLYIPLGGNRKGTARTYFNLIAVFLVCGLWHGAAVTFVLWGLYHGLFLVAERALHGRVPRLPHWLSLPFTLLAVLVGWVIFRSNDWPSALKRIQALFGHASGDGLSFHLGLYLLPDMVVAGIAGILLCGPLQWLAGRLALNRSQVDGAEPQAISPIVWAAILIVGTLSVASLAAGTYNPFIYFRF